MIMFGGLVALLLIVRPRGLLDEAMVHRIGRLRRLVAAKWRTVMKAGSATMLIAIIVCCGTQAHAQARARAELTCKPGGDKLQYDCIIKLADARTHEPLSGISVIVGADMPSMPGAHAVRPVKAAEEDKGTYKARLVLEMHGDWAVRLDLTGPFRDRVVKLLRFEGDKVGEATPTQTPAPGRHRH